MDNIKQDELVEDQTIPVFTYGSLKRGFHNHGLLAEQTFFGKATTAEHKFDLYDLGRFPAMCEGTFAISGEVYFVDKETLDYLDMIEGVDNGFYSRVILPIKVGAKTIKCYAYMISRKQLHFYRAKPDVRDIQGNVKNWLPPVHMPPTSSMDIDD